MIPRFIVRNATKLIPLLIELGYELRDSIPPKDILVLGNSIQPAPIEEQEKHRLIRSFNGEEEMIEIIKQARLQKNWQAATVKTELKVGSKDVGVMITRLGILIDSFIIPITVFKDMRQSLNQLRNPFIASHEPIINPDSRFMTVGCADYSLNDLDQIIASYEKMLSEPTT